MLREPPADNGGFVNQDIQALHARLLNIFEAFTEVCVQHNLNYYLIGGALLGAVRHQGLIPWDDDIDIGMPRADFEKFRVIANEHLPDPFIFLDDSKLIRRGAVIWKIIDTSTVIVHEGGTRDRNETGIFMDVFPIDNVPDNKLVKRTQFLLIGLLVRIIRAGLNPAGQQKRFTKFAGTMISSVLGTKSFTFLHRRLDNIAQWEKSPGVRCLCNFLGAYGAKEYFPSEWAEPLIDLPFAGNYVPGFAAYDKYLTHIYGDYMQLPPEKDRRLPHFSGFIERETGG